MHCHAVQYAVMPVETLSLEQVRPAMLQHQQLQRFIMLVLHDAYAARTPMAHQVTGHNDLA